MQCHRDIDTHLLWCWETRNRHTSLNWQKSKMIDWWIRNYYEQMGEWDEGVRERKHCSELIFITPGGQWGLVVMISCWGSSLDSLSLCVLEVFVSSMLTWFHVSAYVYGCPYSAKATVILKAALQVGRSKEKQLCESSLQWLRDFMTIVFRIGSFLSCLSVALVDYTDSFYIFGGATLKTTPFTPYRRKHLVHQV